MIIFGVDFARNNLASGGDAFLDGPAFGEKNDFNPSGLLSTSKMMKVLFCSHFAILSSFRMKFNESVCFAKKIIICCALSKFNRT